VSGLRRGTCDRDENPVDAATATPISAGMFCEIEERATTITLTRPEEQRAVGAA
jgi:hypothetical protein